MIRPPLFSGVLTHPTTKYVGVPVRNGTIGAQIAWPDATSSATITVELTSYDSTDAPVETAGTGDIWAGSGVSITGPAASARGQAQINIEGVRQARARIKIVTAATTTVTILDGNLTT